MTPTPLRYGIFEEQLRWLVAQDCVDFALTRRGCSHVKGIYYWQVTAYVVTLDTLMADQAMAHDLLLQSTPFEAIPVLMRELSPLQFELLDAEEQPMAFTGAEGARNWLIKMVQSVYPDDQKPHPGTDPSPRPYDNLQIRLPPIDTIRQDASSMVVGGEIWRQ